MKETNFKVNRTYTGFWAETKWIYNFKSDGKYILESKGHGGGNPKVGSYILKDSLILLISETEYFEDWRFKRFKIDNRTNCLRDYWGYFYCKTPADLSSVSEIRFREEQILEKNIEGLKIVTDKRNQLKIQDNTKKYFLRNRGIIIEKGSEFYEYRIESWLPDYRRNQVHLRLYAKYNPIRIYNDEFYQIKEIKTGINNR